MASRLRTASLTVLLITIGWGEAWAQTVRPMWVLEHHAYYNPLLADPRAAQSTVLFPAIADSFPFAVEDRRSLVWDISVGHEFPIDIMTQEGLEIDVHSRSLVLGCRPLMPGETVPAQLRSACRFVLKARQALGAPSAATGVPAPGAGVPAAAAARTRRATPRGGRRRTTRKSRSAAGSTRRVRGNSGRE